jgi:hypothetical protein
MFAHRRLLGIAVILPFLVGCGENRSAPRPNSPRSSASPSSATESPVNAKSPVLKVAVMQGQRALWVGWAGAIKAILI